MKATIITGQPNFKQGKVLHLAFRDRWHELALNALKNCKLGDVVDVEVRPWSDKGTDLQNRFFHPLLREYIKSGLAPVTNFDHLKLYIKNVYGVPPVNVTVAGENMQYVKSWSAYSKRERMQTISGLIDEMLNAGVSCDNIVMEWIDFKKS